MSLACRHFVALCLFYSVLYAVRSLVPSSQPSVFSLQSAVRVRSPQAFYFIMKTNGRSNQSMAVELIIRALY